MVHKGHALTNAFASLQTLQAAILRVTTYVQALEEKVDALERKKK